MRRQRGQQRQRIEQKVEQLYRVNPDVTGLTGLSIATIRRAIAAGSLRVVRIGARSVRVPESALQEWIRRGRAA
jgi:excisionase family DNA binding protein